MIKNKDGLAMNPKDYLYTAALCLGKPYTFINLAACIKRRYVILNFILVVSLLFIPVFALVARTQPDQIYTRMFPQSFEDAVIEYHNTESFSPEKINGARPAIYVFDDSVVYADSSIVLSAPLEHFVSGELSRPFGEVFSMIAVYNLYIPRFMLPVLMIALAILIVLHLFFCFVSAAFLGLLRLASTRFAFGKNLKITIMSALFPALISAGVGFVLPAVHIVLFQMAALLVMFSLSKKYDKKEKELLSTEENPER